MRWMIITTEYSVLTMAQTLSDTSLGRCGNAGPHAGPVSMLHSLGVHVLLQDPTPMVPPASGEA